MWVCVSATLPTHPTLPPPPPYPQTCSLCLRLYFCSSREFRHTLCSSFSVCSSLRKLRHTGSKSTPQANIFYGVRPESTDPDQLLWCRRCADTEVLPLCLERRFIQNVRRCFQHRGTLVEPSPCSTQRLSSEQERPGSSSLGKACGLLVQTLAPSLTVECVGCVTTCLLDWTLLNSWFRAILTYSNHYNNLT